MSRVSRIALIASISGTVVFWTHAALTHAFPPFANIYDDMMWFVACICKSVALLCIPHVLSRVFTLCDGSSRNTQTAVRLWLIAGFMLLGTLSLEREPISRFLNNDMARFYPISLSSPTTNSIYNEGMHGFRESWQSGKIILAEAVCVIGAALGLGVIGLRSGKNGYMSGLYGSLWLAVVVVTGVRFFGLLSWDYDVFFGGTLFGPLFSDLVTPVIAIDPASEIGLLAYSTLIISSSVIIRVLERRIFAAKAIAEGVFEP